MRTRRLIVGVVTALVTVFGGVQTAGGVGSAYGMGAGDGARRVVVVDPPDPGQDARPRPGGLPEYFTSDGDGTRTAATRTDLAAAARHPTLGVHQLLVVPVYWSGTPETPISSIRNVLASTDDYYNRATGGQIRVASAGVRPWTKITLTQSQQDTCDSDAIERAVRALAADYVTDDTHHLVAYMDHLSSCWWAGLATLGTAGDYSSFIWFNDYATTPVWAHELGHNLGLYHSGALYCMDGTTTVTLSDDCTQETYADPWELMGNQPFGQGMISAENLRRLGVLPRAASGVVSVDTETTLTPVESGSGLRGLQVSDGDARYYLEYRAPIGLDAWIDDMTATDTHGVTRTDPGGGLVMRREVTDFGQYGEQDVVDFHPDEEHIPYASHPGMEAGESYTLPGGRLRISVLSTSATGARVSVTFPKAAGVFRRSGADRYAAAVAISRSSFASGVRTLYVASGEVFTDALSGAAVAGRDGSPLLLTRRDRLDQVVADEISRLAPSRIIVFGGPATVSDPVLDYLGAWGVPVTRISGADRYATSALISSGNYASGVGTAYVASGQVFPDALAAAPVAGRSGGPVLLVPGDRIPDATAAELRRLAPKRIVVLGGTSTIQASVQAALAGFTSGSVERWDGADRYAVSALVSQRAFPGGSDVVYVASGLVFPDSLAGAPVAGATPAPLLLVRTDRIPDTVAAELTRLHPKAIVILGGTSSVRSVVADELATFVR